MNYTFAEWEKMIEIVDKLSVLLDQPLKAFAIAAAVLSFYVLKKYSELVSKLTKSSQEIALSSEQIQKEFEDIENRVRSMNIFIGDQISKLRGDVEYMRQDLKEIPDKIESLMTVIDKQMTEIAQIKEDVKKDFGRIIFLEDLSEKIKKDLDVKHKSIQTIAKVLEKHKNGIEAIAKKLPRSNGSSKS